MNKLEFVACNICKKNDYKVYLKKDTFTIVKCQNCGLIYVNPRLNENELLKIYDDLYFTGERRYGIEDYFGRGRKSAQKRAYETIQIIKKHKRQGNILDVGCAGGIFLKVAQENNFNAYGIEVSKYAVEAAEKILNLKIELGTLEKCKFKNKFFDVITLLDVIEHFPDPYCSLQKINSLLKDDGIILIYTPNINSLPFYVIKEGWGIIAPEHHLHYFSPETIEMLLNKTGFIIKKIWFDEIGLAEAFLSHGSFKKVGINISEENRKKISKNYYLLRDFVRNIFRVVDRKILVPFTGKRMGSAMKIIASKRGENNYEKN